ncbi:MAG: hypothetical protein ACRDH0_04910 [Actinomycetota bacterium]
MGAAKESPWPSSPSQGVGAALAAMLLVSCLALGASALEQWGRTHCGEWSLRASLRLQPWRLSATEFLSRNLATLSVFSGTCLVHRGG